MLDRPSEKIDRKWTQNLNQPADRNNMCVADSTPHQSTDSTDDGKSIGGFRTLTGLCLALSITKLKTATFTLLN